MISIRRKINSLEGNYTVTIVKKDEYYRVELFSIQPEDEVPMAYGGGYKKDEEYKGLFAKIFYNDIKGQDYVKMTIDTVKEYEASETKEIRKFNEWSGIVTEVKDDNNKDS